MAFTTVTTIFGPSVSPIFGGALSHYAGWHWHVQTSLEISSVFVLTCSRIFWFLLILAVATFIPMALFLPETCRHVVHDGSILPPWPCINVSDIRRHRNRLKQGLPADQEKKAALRREYGLTMPIPTKTLRVLTDRTSALFLISSSLGRQKFIIAWAICIC